MNRGFALLESIIYIAVTVILITLIATTLGNLYQKTVAHIVQINRYFDMALALDRIVKDVQQSTLDVIFNKSSDAGVLVVSTDTFKCMWRVVKGRLIRVQSTLDKQTNRFGKKAMSVVARSIKASNFLPEMGINGTIIGMNCHLEAMDKQWPSGCNAFIATRIGVFL